MSFHPHNSSFGGWNLCKVWGTEATPKLEHRQGNITLLVQRFVTVLLGNSRVHNSLAQRCDFKPVVKLESDLFTLLLEQEDCSETGKRHMNLLHFGHVVNLINTSVMTLLKESRPSLAWSNPLLLLYPPCVEPRKRIVGTRGSRTCKVRVCGSTTVMSLSPRMQTEMVKYWTIQPFGGGNKAVFWEGYRNSARLEHTNWSFPYLVPQCHPKHMNFGCLSRTSPLTRMLVSPMCSLVDSMEALEMSVSQYPNIQSKWFRDLSWKSK